MQKKHNTYPRFAVLVVLFCTIVIGGFKFWVQRDAHTHGVERYDAVSLAMRSLLNDITQVDRRFVAVGENGIILLSDDQGATWRLASTPVRNTINAVHFSDPRNGIAVGERGVILRTTDGGATWAEVEQQVSDHSSPLLATGWLSPDTVVAVGGFGSALVSHDRGLTWTSMQAALPNESERHLYGLARSDGAALIAGESGTLIRLNQTTSKAQQIPSLYQGSFFGTVSAGNTFLVYGLRGTVFMSNNGGESWHRCSVPTEGSITGAAATRRGDIFITTMNGEVLKAMAGSCEFAALKVRYPGPATGLEVTDDGSLVLIGVRGIVKIDGQTS